MAGHGQAAGSGTVLWRQKPGQIFKNRREKSNPGFHGLGPWTKGNVTLSLPSLISEASRQLHLNWVKASQGAVFQFIFASYEEFLPVHVEFAFKAKDPWTKQNAVFLADLFLKETLEKELINWDWQALYQQNEHGKWLNTCANPLWQCNILREIIRG